MSLHLILLIWLVALQPLDAASTWALLRAGGRELNPLLRALMRAVGVPAALLLAKAALLAALAAWHAALPTWALLLACLAYSALVLNNWRLWRRARRGAA